MNPLLQRFRKAIYEPEHTETTCWCKPQFRRETDGNLHIIHNEQRDVLSALFLTELSARDARVVDLVESKQRNTCKFNHGLPKFGCDNCTEVRAVNMALDDLLTALKD